MRPHDLRKRRKRDALRKYDGIEHPKTGLTRFLKAEDHMSEANDETEVPIIGTYTAAANKDYTCDNCGKLIYKGERYLRVVIKPQGEFKSNHYHYSCA